MTGCRWIYCQYRRKRQQRCKSFAAELMASQFNFAKRLRVTRHEYRKMDYGTALRCGCSCENRFVSKRWHPSFNELDRSAERLRHLSIAPFLIGNGQVTKMTSPHVNDIPTMSEICVQIVSAIDSAISWKFRALLTTVTVTRSQTFLAIVLLDLTWWPRGAPRIFSRWGPDFFFSYIVAIRVRQTDLT